MFQITVNTRRAIVGEKELITTRSAGIQVQFTFSEDWDGLAKFAIFRNGEDDESRVAMAIPSSGLVELPAENCAVDYIDEPIFAGVYGNDGLGTTIIPTIWASMGVLREGASYEGAMPADPTPDMWAQILAIANEAHDIAEDCAEAEQLRAAAEELRVAAETARVAAENGRVSAEEARVTAENLRATAEDLRVTAENARSAAEQNRATAEAARASAEASRQQNESTRQSNETARQTAESNRASAESTRASNEQARRQAETARADAEGARADAETARVLAESARVAAEQARVNAESARGTAEDARASAEALRASAESARASAEAARATAESNRADTFADWTTTFNGWQSTLDGKADQTDLDALSTDVTELNRQISESITPAIGEIETALDSKAPAIYETASGKIASFDDGSDNQPIRSLVANIEPVQDLHGYDYPWPAGGKGNYFNYDAWKSVSIDKGTAVFENNGVSLTATENDAYTQGGSALYPEQARIPVSEGETITLAWEETSNAAGTVYIFPDGGVSGAVSANNAYYKKVSYTVASGVSYVTLRFGVASAGTTISYKNIQVVRGTTVPTWQPYSNICPISGHTGANIKKTGKNILQTSTAYGDSSGVTFRGNNNYTVAIDGTSTGSYPQIALYGTTKKLIPVGTTVTLSHKVHNAPVGSAVYLYVYERDSSTSLTNLASYRSTESGVTFTVQYPYQLIIVVAQGNGLTYTDCTIEYQIEVGSTATSIDTESSFSNIDVSWETEAGTVYGGTLDVTNGVLTVTMAMVDLGTLTWLKSSSGNGRFYCNAQSLHYKYAISTVMICSSYKFDGIGGYADYYGANGTIRYYFTVGTTESRELYITDGSKANMTASEFTLAMSGVQLIYELATPITYQLTPQELDTLLGTNNIWTDVGTVDVEYPADTKLYIDNKITQAIANALNA